MVFVALSLIVVLGAVAPNAAFAQAPATPAQEARPTGLPTGVDWTFNFEASWGNFGFMNSLYTNPKPGEPSGNLGDNWFEGAVKPALTAVYTTKGAWQLWGKASVVGERTYGAAPTLVGEDASSFKPEDLAFGFNSGKALALGENALEFTLGRAPFKVGHGFLLYDGASEGGTRGGYWTNARKAFKFNSTITFQPGIHKAQVFYLEKDELPEANSRTRLGGVNYEAALTKTTTVGGMVMELWANDLRPNRNGMKVYDVRAFTAPFPKAQQVSFEFEYAREANGDTLNSHAWTLQGGYEFTNVTWSPKLSYRYAFFQGDDPATPKSEAWDPLLLGFYDWGTWWQGEIAGEYFISNSNGSSHQVRLHVVPSKRLSTGVIFWDFNADHPESAGPGVTARDVAFEFDWYADWKVNGNITMSVVTAYNNPGRFVEQAYKRTQNIGYAMLFFAYSY